MSTEHSCPTWDELTTDTAAIEINGKGELNILYCNDDDPIPRPSLNFLFCPYCGKKL